jgi:hypothetical protein
LIPTKELEMVTRAKFPSRKNARRADAEQRAIARSKRSPQDQLNHLDALLGVGQGAANERARLAAAIATAERQAEEAAQTKAHEEQVRAAKQAAKAQSKGK